jgi:hypothetical protein
VYEVVYSDTATYSFFGKQWTYHLIEENFKCSKFNTQVINLESLKPNVKSEKNAICLFINGLFNNHVSGSGYKASNGRMIRQE